MRGTFPRIIYHDARNPVPSPVKTLDELNARKDQIVFLINEYTEGRENRILTLRYILGWRWEDIAAELHFSKPHVFLLLNNALDKIVLPEDAPRWFKQE